MHCLPTKSEKKFQNEKGQKKAGVEDIAITVRFAFEDYSLNNHIFQSKRRK